MSDKSSADTTGGSTFDPILTEVFGNRLLTITEDMGNTLIRSSFSTNIKERRDCSVGLFDYRGRCVAQASHMPMHLGSLLGSVEAVLEACAIEDMVEGDAFICNDVFLAWGTHQPDVTVITPIFSERKVRFFAANVGHHSDVGGSVPGSISGTARTIFEEGIRIPVVRIARAGEIDEDLMHLLVQNTREPEDRDLDFRVQIATNERCAQMIHKLVKQMGLKTVERSIDDLLEYTHRRLRLRIADLADGTFSFIRYLDDDGLAGDPVPIKATVTIAGERLLLDFTGSGPQARGAMNMTKSAMRATAYYAVKTALDPNLPPNSGFFDAIEIVAPEGTIVDPRFPAATGARSITANKVAGAILGALQSVLPENRIMACGHDSVPAIVFSGERTDRPGTYVYLETVGGGAGARHDADGMDGIHLHITNSTNLPAEALEHEYSLLVDEYAFVADSGGAGRFRGGLGLARQVRARADGVIFSVRSDCHYIGAPGTRGGGDGEKARLVQNRGTPEKEMLGSKVAHIVLKAGESIRLETGGGGGFGPVAERPLHLLARDLVGGKMSREKAEKDYGPDLVRRALESLPAAEHKDRAQAD